MAAAAPPPGELAADRVEEDPEEVEPWLPSTDSEPEEHPALKPRTPSPESEPDQQPPPPPAAPTISASAEKEEDEATSRWLGWPGASVFRLVVAGEKVGGLIGRRGETMKRLCEETRARVRVLEATDGVAGRIVLISATEETQAESSPAMDAAIKIFKHVNEIEGINPDVILPASAPEICSVRLLVPKGQAVHLIGKQGITIKSVQETTGATIRIIDKDELLSYEMVDERIVEIRGASLKVLKALKSVLGLLRKFLVDHSVLHLFQRKSQAVAQAQDSSKENQVANDYALPANQDLLLSDCRSPLNPKGGRYLSHGRDPSVCDPYSSDQVTNDYALPVNQDILLSVCRSPLNPKGSRYFSYGRDPSVCDPYSSDIRHPTDSLIAKITQTMQIPLPQAEEIIGVRGQNIAYIRSVSGAVVVLEETGDYPNEVLVMIEGSSLQVQTAHQLVQEILLGNREPPPPSSTYGNLDAGPRLMISWHGVPASRDYPPSYREYQPSSDRYSHSTYCGYRL